METFADEALQKAPHYASDSWPRLFLELHKNANYRKNICHLCRGVPSDLSYPGDGNTFVGNYGFWIDRTAIEKGIDTRKAEDEIREVVGIPRNAEWVSETMLYQVVQDIFRDQAVIRQARFDWLRRQSLDIYVPHLRLGIEYQGLQHYQPVEYFGGQESLEQLQERDKRKHELCGQHGVALLYFRFDEELTRETVRRRIEHHLPQMPKEQDG